jgi:hypothetical protein
MNFPNNVENPASLENIKSSIEIMNKYHQIEILKILSKNLSKINENKSGVYVNLSFLPQDTINNLKDYITYTKEQEDSLNMIECQKTEYKNAFFSEKDNKEENTISVIS